MKATKIKYQRTFDLGNYQNEVIGIELELDEGETAKDAIFAAIHYINNTQYEHRQREKFQAVVDNPENRRYSEVVEAKQALSEIENFNGDNLPF